MILGYILLALVVFSMNIWPAFMPPTWIVLAFVYIKYHLVFFPTIIIGATFATLGRIGLYYFAKYYLHRFFNKSSKENFTSLAGFLNTKKKLTIPLLISYAFIPLPSNQVYIAAGIGGLDIKILAISFFIGRLISYSSLVATAHIVSGSLEKIFLGHFGKASAIFIDIAGFVLMYLLSMINWKKIYTKLTHK